MHRESGRGRSGSSDRSRTRHKPKHQDKKDKKHRRKQDRRDSRSASPQGQDGQEKYKRRDREQQEGGSRADHGGRMPQEGSKEYGGRMEQEGSKDFGRRREEPMREEIVKELPCWQPSGILVQFYNSRQGVSLKFHEPPESRRPLETWRIYIFKGEQVFQPVLLTESCYLFGKDPRVCDVLCENESISRQHAVLQFRLAVKQEEDGSFSEQVKPYLLDLESTNGTILNGEKIETSRYIQLLERDILQFGFSDREYVMVREEASGRPEHQHE